MLKSTHQAAPAPPPLPSGWTEHKAPTGHLYYYNAETKQSTYKRPTVPVAAPLPPPVQPGPPGAFQQGNAYGFGSPQQSFPHNGANFSQNPNLQPLGQPANDRHGMQQQQHSRRKQPEDRPKKKKAILNCAPWILVYTRFRRRFVYNPELGESFWKFPPEVMKAVIEMDRIEWETKQREARGELSEPKETIPKVAETVAIPLAQPTERAHSYDSDEYEEVEVTDDEDEAGPNKKARIEEDQPEGPVEFNEDDIAYQLAQMGQEDDNEEQWPEEYEEEPPLSEEDAKALFCDLLDDHNISPYTPWDTIIEEGKIVEDERYTCLPNMKSRKEAWEMWSRDRIQRLKERRAREEKKDPKIPYMAFLQKNATPKLYWPEFRRKYNKQPEMRDNKLKDKDREKWYREYINRLKLSESTLKEDLTELLRSLPLSAMNRSTSLSALPAALLTDLRYISLRTKVRDPLIEAYIAVQPPAPATTEGSLEEEEAAARKKQERRRREKALADRERRVEEDNRKARGRLQYSKGMLREEQEDLEQAMKVGREGLLGHYEGDKEMQEPEAS